MSIPLKFELLSNSRVLPKPWLIEGWFGAADIVVMVGEPGVGKSALLASLVAAIAGGSRWFGYAAPRGSALYLALERCDDTKRNLMAAITGDSATRVGIVSEPIDLTRAENADRVIEAVAKLAEQSASPVRLIVIDTLSLAAHVADENSASAMTPFMATIGRIARETGATVILAHHPPRSSSHVRGSIAIDGRADAIVSIKKAQAKRVACVTKSNAASLGTKIEFQIQPQVIKSETDQFVGVIAVETEHALKTSRAASVFALSTELQVNNQVSRSALLEAARARGILSSNGPSSGEQLRVSLLELKRLGRLDYNGKVVRLKSTPNSPPPLVGGAELGIGIGALEPKATSNNAPKTCSIGAIGQHGRAQYGE